MGIAAILLMAHESESWDPTLIAPLQRLGNSSQISRNPPQNNPACHSIHHMWQPGLPCVQPQDSQVELSKAAGSGSHLRLAPAETDWGLGVSILNPKTCISVCVLHMVIYFYPLRPPEKSWANRCGKHLTGTAPLATVKTREGQIGLTLIHWNFAFPQSHHICHQSQSHWTRISGFSKTGHSLQPGRHSTGTKVSLPKLLHLSHTVAVGIQPSFILYKSL